jgi:hypothetical protein
MWAARSGNSVVQRTHLPAATRFFVRVTTPFMAGGLGAQPGDALAFLVKLLAESLGLRLAVHHRPAAAGAPEAPALVLSPLVEIERPVEDHAAVDAVLARERRP